MLSTDFTQKLLELQDVNITNIDNYGKQDTGISVLPNRTNATSSKLTGISH